jgi:hypothetical protein
MKANKVVSSKSRKEYPGGLPEDRLNNVIISKEETKPTVPTKKPYKVKN